MLDFIESSNIGDYFLQNVWKLRRVVEQTKKWFFFPLLLRPHMQAISGNKKQEMKRWCQDRCDFITLKWGPNLPPKCIPNKQEDVICNLPSVLLQKLRSNYLSPTVPMLLNFRHTRKTRQLICGQKSTTQRMYFGRFIKQSKKWVCSFQCQVQCNWVSPIRICSEFIP